MLAHHRVQISNFLCLVLNCTCLVIQFQRCSCSLLKELVLQLRDNPLRFTCLISNLLVLPHEVFVIKLKPLILHLIVSLHISHLRVLLGFVLEFCLTLLKLGLLGLQFNLKSSRLLS